MFNSEFKPVKNLLHDVIANKGWANKLLEARMPEIWNASVGDVIAKSTRVKKFENGCLFINADSSTWRAELLLRKNQLIEKLNDSIGERAIEDLIIR